MSTRKLQVKVVPGAKVVQIQEGIDGGLKVWVKSKPEDGKANRELIEVLAKHLKINKRRIIISSGQKNRNKLIEITE